MRTIEQLEQKLLEMKADYLNATEIFRPFLQGSMLQQIFNGLVSLDSSVSEQYDQVVDDLARVIKWRKALEGDLLPIHTPLMNVLIERELVLLLRLLNQLKAMDPLSIKCLDNKKILETIFADTAPHPTFKAQMDNIQKSFSDLNRRLFQKKMADLEQVIRKAHKEAYENHDAYMRAIMPVRKELELLKDEAEKAAYPDQVVLIQEGLGKLDTMSAFLVKKELDSHMQRIQQHAWSGLEQKRLLALELIVFVERFMPFVVFIRLGEGEKERYSRQLREGFELTGDRRFLELIRTCAGFFYLENSQKGLQLMQYVNQSMSDIEKKEAELKAKKMKRVRFASEISSDLETPPAKKAKLSNAGDMVEADSETVEKFINVLTPVCQEERLSRRFAAALLNPLSDCLAHMPGVLGQNKVMMRHTLLNEARKVCPADELQLHQDLSEKIKAMELNYSQILGANRHFSGVEFTTSQFKAILSDLVDEIKSYLPKEAVNLAIEKLLKDWINLVKARNIIDPKYIDQIVTSLHLDAVQSTDASYQGLEPSSNTQGSLESSSPAEKTATPSHTVNFFQPVSAEHPGVPAQRVIRTVLFS